MNQLREEWLSVWPQALELWSPYVRLHDPCFCLTEKEEKLASLAYSFAMIRLTDLSVVLSLRQIETLGLESYALEIMAHEIGHHVYAPANLQDMGRMYARMGRALSSQQSKISLVANLYTDLLINDRLFRSHDLRMPEIYQKINQPTDDPLWNFYLRIYEILWSLPRKTLTQVPISDEMEADALLGNRLIRNYAQDWIKGSGKFAALCLTYLLQQEALGAVSAPQTLWLDTALAGEGASLPYGLSSLDPGEEAECRHPALDERDSSDTKGIPAEVNSQGNSAGNYREPFQYGELIQSMGIQLSGDEILYQYYKERALPYIIPFPAKIVPSSVDPLPEGLETWELGDPLEQINWLETVMKSPVVIPGFTTVERVYGKSQGADPEKEPVDLDIYVDCSGSMPNPSYETSFLTLAAAIISLSALRSGSRVQATLWSGVKQFYTTPGFVRDEKEVFKVMTQFIGGATAFPLHILRDTYFFRTQKDRNVHILVISDDGVTTIFDQDEKGNSGEDITRMSIENARGGCTFVLNLYSDWKTDPLLVKADQMGIALYTIRAWSDLVAFSRDFAQKNFNQ